MYLKEAHFFPNVRLLISNVAFKFGVAPGTSCQLMFHYHLPLYKIKFFSQASQRKRTKCCLLSKAVQLSVEVLVSVGERGERRVRDNVCPVISPLSVIIIFSVTCENRADFFKQEQFSVVPLNDYSNISYVALSFWQILEDTAS